MRRRLFIPGTGGCFFEDDNGARHASILDLALDHQKDFVCEHADDPAVLAPLRTSGLTNHGQPVRLTAAGPIRGVYDAFFDETVALGSTTKAYRFYDYDWRLDLRHNGELLWQWLQEHGTDEAWDVVCHSQGGLVVLWASLLAGAEQFPRFVRRLVFCGVPIQGTVNAASALVSGSQLLPGLAADAATVRSWPSIYMMLPRWRLGVPGTSGAESFKESTWRTAGLLAPGADLSQGISPALLARAQEWKRQIDTFDFAPLAALDRFVICQGHHINTWARTPAFPMFPSLAGPRDGQILVDGDGLAPNRRSVQFLPPSLLSRASSLLVPVRSHLLMCSSIHQVLLCNRIFT